MLICSCLKTDIISLLSFKSYNTVCKNCLICVSNMRFT